MSVLADVVLLVFIWIPINLSNVRFGKCIVVLKFQRLINAFSDWWMTSVYVETWQWRSRCWLEFVYLHLRNLEFFVNAVESDGRSNGVNRHVFTTMLLHKLNGFNKIIRFFFPIYNTYIGKMPSILFTYHEKLKTAHAREACVNSSLWP